MAPDDRGERYTRQLTAREIAEELRRRIDEGEFAATNKLPSLGDLAAQVGGGIGAGIDTVKAAIDALRHEGLLTTTRGQLTRVRAKPARRQVPVSGPAVIQSRMPTATERTDMNLDVGVPLLIVLTHDGTEELGRYAADDVELVIGKPSHQ